MRYVEVGREASSVGPQLSISLSFSLTRKDRTLTLDLIAYHCCWTIDKRPR